MENNELAILEGFFSKAQVALIAYLNAVPKPKFLIFFLFVWNVS